MRSKINTKTEPVAIGVGLIGLANALVVVLSSTGVIGEELTSIMLAVVTVLVPAVAKFVRGRVWSQVSVERLIGETALKLGELEEDLAANEEGA